MTDGGPRGRAQEGTGLSLAIKARGLCTRMITRTARGRRQQQQQRQHHAHLVKLGQGGRTGRYLRTGINLW